MDEPNFANRTLFHGDNLGFLQGLNSGSVHLIATDPPFNKGRDFHATPDSLAAGGSFEDRWSWDEDVHDDWIEAIQDFDKLRKRTKRGGEYQQELGGVWTAIKAANTTWGRDMGAFLCYMGVRLLEMKRVLAEDGSLYLHCDPTASHYLKIMLDAIFGRRNFRNEIVWCYTTASTPYIRQFVRCTDVILWYNKGKVWTFNKDDVRVPYKGGAPHGGQGWSDGEEPLEKWRERKGAQGKIPENWWEIPKVGTSRERYGYATQKPLKLYERIIRASSNEGDVVLDPFAGCATTVVAAELLNRQWIGMDIWDGAHKAVVQRLLTEGMLSPGGVPDAMLADLAVPDQQGPLITFGQLHYSTTPPERTDKGEIAAPAFTIPAQRAIPRWQRLSRAEIVARLEEAQAGNGGVICGGCGIVLAARYMELDHVQPRADGGPNDIMNRLLLCGPCNNLKRENLTLSGLRKECHRRGWMVDEDRAKLATAAARECAERTVVELS